MGKTETYRSHHRHEVQFEHTFRCAAVEGRHDNKELVFPRVGLADVVDDGDMLRFGGLQEVCTFITSLYQQGGRFAVDESKDAVVHILYVARYRPVETLLKGIECPQPCIVTLGGNHLSGTDKSCNVACQLIGTANMSGQYRDDVLPQTVDTDDGRVGMLVFDIRCNGTDTDAHSTDEHKGIVFLPLFSHVLALDDGGFHFYC